MESNPERADIFKSRKKERDRKRREGIGDIVYFARATTGGPIKIGYTSKNPECRLSGLNVGHWQEFEIVGVMFGGRREESDLHYRFRNFAIRGEWFRDEPELLEYIKQNAIPWTVNDGRQAERFSEPQTQTA